MLAHTLLLHLQAKIFHIEGGNKNYFSFYIQMLNTTNTLSHLRYSRIQDHNVFPNTDVLYEPLRKVLLSPEEVAIHRNYLNPAATHSRVTRDFAYLTEN